MARFSKFVGFGLLLWIASCVETPPVPNNFIERNAVSFDDVPGWTSDHVLEAVPALAHSCSVLEKKAGWTALCASLKSSPPSTNQQAQQFFEQWFQPYAILGKDGEEGLFTGYYEAELQGSPVRTGSFQTPLYARPDDLITVDLGKFKDSLRGQTIAGKVVTSSNGKKLEPYDDRATILQGSLDGRAQPLLWVNNPIDAFFLAIQGSGRVRMTDQSIVRVGYDASNSRPYVAVGKILADSQEISKPVTMQSIRVWMTQHPEKATAIMNLNASYVFFRILKPEELQADGPKGAEGVSLTPQRSLAVDPAFIDLGTPVWLDSTDSKGNILQRLLIAQDTGGAIKGAVRGDVFWGYGPEAEEQAGAMQSKGRYFVLLPKADPFHAHP